MRNTAACPRVPALARGFAIAFIIGLLILILSSASNAQATPMWNGEAGAEDIGINSTNRDSGYSVIRSHAISGSPEQNPLIHDLEEVLHSFTASARMLPSGRYAV